MNRTKEQMKLLYLLFMVKLFWHINKNPDSFIYAIDLHHRNHLKQEQNLALYWQNNEQKRVDVKKLNNQKPKEYNKPGSVHKK